MQDGSCKSGSDGPLSELRFGYGGAAIKGSRTARLTHWLAHLLAQRLGWKPPVDDGIIVPLAGNIVFVGYLFAKDLFPFLQP